MKNIGGSPLAPSGSSIYFHSEQSTIAKGPPCGGGAVCKHPQPPHFLGRLIDVLGSPAQVHGEWQINA